LEINKILLLNFVIKILEFKRKFKLNRIFDRKIFYQRCHQRFGTKLKKIIYVYFLPKIQNISKTKSKSTIIILNPKKISMFENYYEFPRKFA